MRRYPRTPMVNVLTTRIAASRSLPRRCDRSRTTMSSWLHVGRVRRRLGRRPLGEERHAALDARALGVADGEAAARKRRSGCVLALFVHGVVIEIEVRTSAVVQQTLFRHGD